MRKHNEWEMTGARAQSIDTKEVIRERERNIKKNREM